MIHDSLEWLEPDGLGGFASGTTSTIRTRRYHALLLPATVPPTGRVVLVSGVEAWALVGGARVALTTQRYQPGVEYPDGVSRLSAFVADPWPTWTWQLPDGSRIVHQVMVPHGRAAVVLSWRREAGDGPAALEVRPLIAGRDYHSLQHENGSFRFAPTVEDDQVVWRPYDGVPAIRARSNGRYRHQPEWYRNFLYTAEAERGLDAVEDLASPGVFEFDLAVAALLVLTTEAAASGDGREVAAVVADLESAERSRRAGFGSRLKRAADAYIVKRGEGRTIIAGYPWFTDWGRDTFIALRGLTLATGRLADARAILVEWAGTVSEGMLPNRFPDGAGAPEYNAVDASLWYVVVVDEFLEACARADYPLPEADRQILELAVRDIVDGYARGTRYGIRMDADGLLACGVPGVQLTWMDAKIGDWVVTPRVGKPVEVQALWVNALAAASRRDPDRRADVERARKAFDARFWNPDQSCLFDVVDVDHVAGQMDPSLRPNQLLAIGGLPVALVDGDRARQVLAIVKRELLTPLGPRSLGPSEPGYRPHYVGDGAGRDSAYHQGTVWPWLVGALVDAALRTSSDRATGTSAVGDLIAALVAHLDEAGLGHVSEIADAEPPFTPRGCPFQAWSVGELIRALAAVEAAAGPTPAVGTKGSSNSVQR
jgi:predicted glycogen debranching enzyme